MRKIFSLFWMFISHYGILLLILYILVILGRVVWKNWQVNLQIAKLQSEIDQTKKENQYLENLILYYQTSSFKEIEARRKLGLKKPGEKVIPVEVVEEEKPLESYFGQTAPPQASLPNYLKWWQIFFR